MRADEAAANALKISRSKASELIKRSLILCGGKVILKASANVDENLEFSCLDEIFVSRGALKLDSFLKSANIEIKGKRALDIGSSTGGFTQILLKYGAKCVTCVDVGTNQLDKILRDDKRVEFHENTDIRDFKSDEGFDIISADVSFVPLKIILPSIKRLANDDIIMLFKPQFEVGLGAKRSKNGVVNDEKAVSLARKNYENECEKMGFKLIFSKPCDIKGKAGNKEFFYHYKVLS